MPICLAPLLLPFLFLSATVSVLSCSSALPESIISILRFILILILISFLLCFLLPFLHPIPSVQACMIMAGWTVIFMLLLIVTPICIRTFPSGIFFHQRALPPAVVPDPVTPRSLEASPCTEPYTDLYTDPYLSLCNSGGESCPWEPVPPCGLFPEGEPEADTDLSKEKHPRGRLE